VRLNVAFFKCYSDCLYAERQFVQESWQLPPMRVSLATHNGNKQNEKKNYIFRSGGVEILWEQSLAKNDARTKLSKIERSKIMLKKNTKSLQGNGLKLCPYILGFPVVGEAVNHRSGELSKR
jgi:hypothetical protein